MVQEMKYRVIPSQLVGVGSLGLSSITPTFHLENNGLHELWNFMKAD